MLVRADASELDRARAALDEHGCVVLERVWPSPFVQNVRDAYVAWIAEGERTGRGRGEIVGDKRYLLPVELGGALGDQTLIVSPRVVPLLGALLGDDFVLNSFASVIALPGADAQPRHKDHDFLFAPDVAARLPPWALTMVVPLVALDERTGTTAVVPGSHRRDDADPRDVTVEPSLALGDALVMDYRLSHFGTPNRSPRVRPVLYVVYSRPWFLDERNFRALPPVLLPSGGAAALAPPVRARLRAARPAVAA